MWGLSPRIPSAAVWLLTLPALTCAQSVPADSLPPIGLDEARARTLADHPALRALGFHINAAEGRLQQAGIAPYPQLDVAVQDVVGTDAFRGLSGAETTVSISWGVEVTPCTKIGFSDPNRAKSREGTSSLAESSRLT